MNHSLVFYLSDRWSRTGLRWITGVWLLLSAIAVVADQPATPAQSGNVAAPISVPEKPDDPQAVAALTKLGVKLELNEKGNVHAADTAESKLTDAALVHFRGLHQLTVLDLSDKPITDSGVESLGDLKVLQELYLANTQVTDRSLKALAKFTQLEILSLQKTRATGAGLVNLQNMRHLMVLNLSHCDIRDEDLKHLQKLPMLEVLTVPGTKITTAGMELLRPVTKLRVLNVIDCAVDDGGLEPLKAPGDLRMLYVKGTKVTAEGIKMMEADYPSLAIFD